jgi:hypothetical protein
MYDSLLISVVFFPLALLLAFGLFYWSKGQHYEFDCSLGKGSFFGVFVIYRRLFYTIFAVSLAISIYSAFQGWPPATIILGAAAIDAILAITWVSWSYESYLGARWPLSAQNGIGQTNYSGRKYALTLALGVSSILLFIVGLISFLATLLER